MKTQMFKLYGLLFIALTVITSCKNKEESYTTSDNEDLDTEEMVAMTTPVNSKLPSDVYPSCTVDSGSFNKWFQSGKVSENGAVNPANSVTFGHLNNCDFYKWSEQMFLWMTSPSKDGDYSQGTVMESSVFYTVSPKINGERTLIPHVQGQPLSVVANTQKNDALIDTEEGQATDDVLMAQDGSLLYYISMVNDVYAQFLTGVKTNKLNGDEFPTTQTQLDSIVDFAKSQGVTLVDPDALAIEVKTAWVDASTISDLSTYITIEAIVPTYKKTDTVWTQIDSTSAKLALIGAHIVGSTAGHPELVWATYEHTNNAPNLSYSYTNTEKETTTVPADTGNDWLLNGDSASSDYNVSHMTFSNDSIIAQENMIISASNTTKTKAWGVAEAGVPNPENATGADSNTQVLSINNSVLGQLSDGDMRKNYVFIGATWTDSGTAPNGTSYSASNTAKGVAIGTSQLANSTMETYAQHGSAFSTYGSCFACHSNGKSPSLDPIDLSHVFDEIQPLSEGSN